MTHTITELTLTRLGGKEHTIRCTCGVTTAHADADTARRCMDLYHADLMAVAL